MQIVKMKCKLNRNRTMLSKSQMLDMMNQIRGRNAHSINKFETSSVMPSKFIITTIKPVIEVLAPDLAELLNKIRFAMKIAKNTHIFTTTTMISRNFIFIEVFRVRDAGNGKLLYDKTYVHFANKLKASKKGTLSSISGCVHWSRQPLLECRMKILCSAT